MCKKNSQLVKKCGKPVDILLVFLRFISFVFLAFNQYTLSMNKDFSEKLDKLEHALNKAISMDISNSWKEHSFGKLSDSVSTEHLNTLIEPNKKLIQLGGKRWRPLLMILCWEMEKENHPELNTLLNEEQIYSLTPLIEFVHTASLIHDDIEDSADLRRGQPAAHITYGLDTALNAGSWLYFEAPVCINELKVSDEIKLKLYQLYTKELRRLHLGQAMDIYWHRNKEIFPEIDEYKSMVKCKTGTLASLAAQLGFIAAGASEEIASRYGEVAANIGIGFQILDDVINLTKGNPGKKRGDDIVEGKKSLPILLHILQRPQDKAKISELLLRAQNEGIESSAVEECISLLETSNCINSAALLGQQLIQENCALFSQSPYIIKLFDSMMPKEDK